MSLIHNNNFRWYHYRDNFLSQKQCSKLVEEIDNASEKPEDRFWSDSKIEKAVKLNDIKVCDESLVDKYWKLFKLVNVNYNFHITGIQRNGVYGKRYSTDWTEDEFPHTDFSAGEGKYVDSTTKFTCVTYLNDDMEGGELQVTNDKIPVEVGRAIIFPSFTNHKVMQFYNKNRYVLVCFAEGNTFK
jgi:hypothetical protein|tara:strand:- start:4215 stop:4772 length:558 start_codon:yes stop_codon:yes gene_type:complete